MMFRAAHVVTLPATVAWLWLAGASFASAQDAMQLDYDFKTSVAREHPTPEVEQGRDSRGRRRDEGRDVRAGLDKPRPHFRWRR
jgi:hypothetical protein